MIFTIELKDRTVYVEADRIKIVNDKIMLFNVERLSIPSTTWHHETETLVGAFGGYINFYIGKYDE